jgi:aryl-alcohol dehydrogenase-like predicted oxidoreductase
MEYRALGKSGLRVSELCLGTMYYGGKLDEAASFELMTASYEAGINLLDTADVYSGGNSETIIGKWLKKGIARRDEILINTKVRAPAGKGPNEKGLSRHHVLTAAEGSLRRLEVDYIDLYMPHWPDETTGIEETLIAMNDLVRRGDVRYVGISAYQGWRLMQALWTADVRDLVTPVCVENHYNIVQREEYERDVEQICRAYGMGVIAYGPVSEGFLTGKYRRGVSAPTTGRMSSSRYHVQGIFENEANWEVVDKLRELGEKRGKTISQMAIGWVLTQPTITTALIGPISLEQLRENLGAGGLTLTGEEMTAIGGLSSWRQRRWAEGQLDHDYSHP